MIKALRAIVHRDVSPSEAQEIYNSEKSEETRKKYVRQRKQK